MSTRFVDKKTTCAGLVRAPSSTRFPPPLRRWHSKFPERCRPLICACLPNLVRVGWGLQEIIPEMLLFGCHYSVESSYGFRHTITQNCYMQIDQSPHARFWSSWRSALLHCASFKPCDAKYGGYIATLPSCGVCRLSVRLSRSCI